jgi:hypothetical protein
MDERKRESIVAYLRRRMAEFGIEPEDIATSIAADQERLRAVRFRDASGNTCNWLLVSRVSELAGFPGRPQTC